MSTTLHENLCKFNTQSHEWDGHKAVQLLNRLSYKQCLQLIDFPIPVQDDSISVKIKLKISGSKLPNAHYFVGIVPDCFKQFDRSIFSSTFKKDNALQSVYGFFGIKDYYIRDGINGWASSWHLQNDADDNILFDNESIICMEYDGKMKQLKLINYETKGLKGAIKIPPTSDVTYWYPAISLRHRDDSVQIV